jgi:hypothetical protein
MQRDGGRVVRAVATGWRWVWVSEDAASHVHRGVPGVATTLGGIPTPGVAPPPNVSECMHAVRQPELKPQNKGYYRGHPSERNRLHAETDQGRSY